MKSLVIILGLACAGLAVGYYKRHTGANEAASQALLQHQTLSNQVVQLETKLALANGTASQTQSNLQSTLDRRITQLAATSNRLVQVGLLLSTAQAEKATAQSELQAKAAQLALVEHERDELQRRLSVVPTLENQLTESRRKAAKLTSDLEFLFLENRRLQAERNEVASKMEDVAYLRLQLEKAEENAELQRRLARAGHKAPVDKRAPLELLPDGTVRVVSPTVADARP